MINRYEDEPTVEFRAADRHTVRLLLDYRAMLQNDVDVTPEYRDEIAAKIDAFRIWRAEHFDKVGSPERNKATGADYSMTYGLKCLKMDLAGLKATQMTDTDAGDDPDDDAVNSTLDAVESAIDDAIAAQAKDTNPDKGEDS